MTDISNLRGGDKMYVSWCYSGGEPGEIVRLTKTLAIDEKGRRWRRDSGRESGPGRRWVKPLTSKLLERHQQQEAALELTSIRLGRRVLERAPLPRLRAAIEALRACLAAAEDSDDD